MQGLIDHPARPLGDRGVAAMVAIMERLRTAEHEARSTRLRLAHELGFDARHPSEVKVGDTIRTPSGQWFEVCSLRYVNPENGTAPFWRFNFADAEGAYEIDDWSDDAPISPRSVLVALPEGQEPF